MSVQVIIINGLGQSGKSSFAKYACEYISSFPNTWAGELSTIDCVKAIAKDCGWNGEKNEESRKLLFELKKCLEDYNHYPSETVIEQIKDLEEKYGDKLSIFCFVNIREPEAICYFENRCLDEHWNVETVLVERTDANFATDETELVAMHIYDWPYTTIVYNDEGLEELKKKAQEYMLEFTL